MKITYYVYVYIDPRNDVPFYIGAGHGNRAWQHLKSCKRKSKAYSRLFYNKLRKLLRSGVEPVIRFIVKDLTRHQAFKIWEPFFIKAIGRRDLGTGPLCNHTDGGEGMANLSPEARARRDARRDATMAKPEVKAKYAEATKKHMAKPGVKAKHAAATKKAMAKPGVSDKISAGVAAAWARPEVQAKHAASWANPEVKARHTAAIADPEAQARRIAARAKPEAQARYASTLRNKPPRKGKFKGVYKSDGNWRARLYVLGKLQSFGTFNSPEEAAQVCNDAIDLYYDGDGWKNPVNLKPEELIRLDRASSRRNSPPQKGKFKGVYKHGNKWRASMCVNSKLKHFGTHDTPEEAAQAWNDGINLHYDGDGWMNPVGEFANA